MTRDRHADRLYVRLAGGEQLTRDERRHVATCAACQRARADARRLDDELRAATAALATEPIPEAELAPATPASGWTGVLGVAAAAAVIAVATAIGFSELRPPTGTDATPSLPAALASDVPISRPSATPIPPPDPRATPLVAGPAACSDGHVGFSIMVPEGWYANLRDTQRMACTYVAPEAFDPAQVDPSAPDEVPIRLTVSAHAKPAGTMVQADTQTPSASGEGFATRWLVERAGERWLVYVVPLATTLGDSPAFLHLQARAQDQAATAALNAVVDRLDVFEPIASATDDAQAAADELFAEADACSDLERGINVILPDAWWTNTAIDDLAACSYFAPAYFELGEPGAIPDGVAISIELATGAVGTIEEILGKETLVVDSSPARLWELTPGLGAPPPATRTYQYIVSLDDTPDDGPSLVASVWSERSDDYERDKVVLDEMMRRLMISPTPPEIRRLEPLPSCGWELVQRTTRGDVYDVDARDCLWEAYEAGEQAELISTSPTVEGTIVREIYRVIARDEIELIVDATHDHLGSGGWAIHHCTGLARRSAEGQPDVILFEPTGCGQTILTDP
jgi:hypothetical protein